MNTSWRHNEYLIVGLPWTSYVVCFSNSDDERWNWHKHRWAQMSHTWHNHTHTRIDTHHLCGYTNSILTWTRLSFKAYIIAVNQPPIFHWQFTYREYDWLIRTDSNNLSVAFLRVDLVHLKRNGLVGIYRDGDFVTHKMPKACLITDETTYKHRQVEVRQQKTKHSIQYEVVSQLLFRPHQPHFSTLFKSWMSAHLKDTFNKPYM